MYYNNFTASAELALALICMKLFNICANKLSLSLSLSLWSAITRGTKEYT